VYLEAAKQVKADRERAEQEGLVKPGQAEYLDLLRAAIAIAEQSARQPLEVLKEIKGFALSKNPSQTT
jgi:hypothetical protein